LLSPRVTRQLISEFVSQPGHERHSPAELEELTDREREVLALVAAGLTNAEIAERLVISPATAETHVSRILLKLDARDRAQLVVIAYESGLVKARSTPERTSPTTRCRPARLQTGTDPHAETGCSDADRDAVAAELAPPHPRGTAQARRTRRAPRPSRCKPAHIANST